MDLPGLATRGTPHPPVVGSGGQIIAPIAAKPDESSKKQLGVIRPVEDMISSGDIIFVDHDPPLGQQPLGQQASVVAAPSAMNLANANAMEPPLPQELQQQQQQQQQQQLPTVPAGGEHALGAAVPSSYSSTNGNEGIIPNGFPGRMEDRSVDGLVAATAVATDAAGAASFTAAGVSPTDSLPMGARGSSSATRNSSAKKTSKSSPSKSSSRSVSKQGKAKGKSKKKGTLTSFIANWKCIGDEGVCNVCFDSESYVENPMLRCASCGVLVHQHCYGCRSAPDEGRPWFCDPCSHGESTSTLSCALCSETGARGGAFKMVTPGIERARSWVHVSCAMWIPEVFVGSDELEPVHLEYVPKDRKTLKCVLCGKRGACVQCAGGRCLVAYHPWCLLHTDKKLEFLFRSLDPKGGLNVYCRKHIADIKVPLDLPEKDSQVGPQTYKEAHERIAPKLMVYVPVAQDGPGKVGKSGRAVGKDKQGGGRSKESKKRARDNGSHDVIDVEASPIGIRQRQTPKHPQYKKEQERSQQPRKNLHDKKRRKKSIPSPGVTQAEEPPSVEREAALMDAKDKDVDDEGNLVLHTFWDKAGAPRVGQDAGITTDKLWEVASAQFAEDHKEGWLRKLVDIKHLPKDNDPIFVVPESKKKEKSDQKAGSKEEDGKDGDSSDDSMSIDGDVMEDDDMGDEDDDTVTPRKDGKAKIPAKGFRSSARLGGGSDVPLGDPKVYDEEFKKIECHQQTGVLLQKGKLRAGCRFGLRIVRNNEDFAALRKNERETGVEWMRYEQPWPAGFQQSPNTFPFPGLLKAGDGSSAGGASRDNVGVLLPAPPPAPAINGALGGPMNGASGDGGGNHDHSDDDDLGDIYVALSGWKAHNADDSEIRLRYGGTAAHKGLEGEGAAGQVVPSQGAPLPELKDDVTELLGSMQAKLKEITDRSRSKIEAIIARSTPEVRAANEFRCNNDRVFKRLGRVQAWKSLFNKLEFGIADRPLNFNQTDASVVLDVPASWGRNAEGRQSKEEFEAQMRAHVEAANKEDAVCMVCFDGTTDDNKDIQIVYCDGCGMSVHQHCYGVKDVEADFCCERCKELRRIEDETGSADPEAVRCALCPVIHGAFKKTAGNQWVHMACMLTIPGSRMDDLVNKTQIDLSEVHIDPYIVPPLLQFPIDALPFQQPARQTLPSALDTIAATGSAAEAAGSCSTGFVGEGETSVWQALVQAHAQQAASAQYSGGADQAVATATTSSSAVDSTEEVDVSTPSAVYVHPKSSVLPPRRAPERELACCFCLGTDGSLLDCGITECGVGGGGVLRHGEGPALCGPCGADGNRGDGIAVCGKRFHLLCAWFAGAYVKIGATDPSFTRGERGIGGDMESWPEPGQPRFGFPTGLFVEARCLEHSIGAPGRKGAPPELARVVTPAGSGGGLAAADTFVEGTTSEEQSKLRSKYRFKGHPEWQLEGTKRKKSKTQMKKKKQKNAEREQQSTMRLSKPRALQPDKYERFECAVCMKSLLPMLGRSQKNTDVSAGASADTGSGSGVITDVGAGEADAPPATSKPDVVKCSGCGVRVHRECYGVPEDVGRPGTGNEWFCVPCSSRVNEPTCTLCPRKGGAFVRIRGAHYCHAFCADCTPGARLVDPVSVPDVQESTAAGGGAGAGVALRNEEAFTDWLEAESGRTGGKASKAKGSKTNVTFEELEGGSLETGEEAEEASAGGRGPEGLGSKMSANKTLAGKVARVGNGSGAGGKVTAACAKTAETKNIPKELKKSNNKCHICSRKGGVVVPCSHARSPCERWMHPMCAAQNNRYSRRLSPEEAEASRFKGMYAFMCNDHVPPCLRHVSSGHWVDFLSLYRMRADLDRARVLFDCVLRREKIKRQLHRTSSDMFDTCLAHLRSSAAASASSIRDRLDSIATVAAAAKVAASAAPDSSSTEREGVGSETRRGAAAARAKEEARAAAAAAVEAAAAKAAEAANAKKAASRKGSESKIAAAIANVPWYGKYSPVEDNAVTLPEISGLGLRLRTPRAGDLGSSEYGRVRKKTLKAEEAGGHAGAEESRPFTVADAKAIAAAAGTGVFDQIGISSDDDRNSRSNSRGGSGDGDGDRNLSHGRGPSGSLGGIGDDKRRHPMAADGGRDRWPVISSATATQRKALWEPGRRPSVGREDSHERSKAALTKLVDTCVESVPLQGIVEGVLTAGKKGTIGRRQGPEHFGAVLNKLVGGRNMKAFMEARKAYVEEHPPSKIPPPSSPRQTLRDRQLKDLCDTICEYRVPREDGDPRWESGKVKPDDGKRDLGELFDEAPSRASYPEYYAKVTNVMDLKIIKAKVLDRKYPGLGDLVEDVAVMYSNAQAIEHAQAIKDGKRLFQLAQRTAESLHQEEREGKTHREKLAALDESADKTPEGLLAVVGRSLKPITCVKCDKLRGNPQSKPFHKKENYWFCEACVAENPLAFVGHRVGVLWDGHGKWLTATITGYEPLSGKHEVLYTIDEHWEFVNIGSPRSHIRYFHPLPPTSLASPTSGAVNDKHSISLEEQKGCPRSTGDGAVGRADIPGKSGAAARGSGCNYPSVGTWVAEQGRIEPTTSTLSSFVPEKVNGVREIERESNGDSSVEGSETGSGRTGKRAAEDGWHAAEATAAGEAHVSDKRLKISRH